MNSILISFEGPEGSGKTTIVQKIKPELEKYREVLLTREPGGEPIAEELRSIIMDTKNTQLDSETEMLLFAAARRLHMNERVKPALVEGKIVILDRFIDSSVAYQGYAGGIGIENVKWLNHFATDGLLPDLTFYFDLEAEEGLKRIMASEEREKTRLDLASLDYHNKVVKAYRKLSKENTRFVKIDASQSIEEVTKLVLDKLFQKYPEIFK
ncbi:MAG: dTMP kinase [Lactovum sp.]